MESISGYFSLLCDATDENEWTASQNITFRQIADKEAYIRGKIHLHGGFVLHVSEYVILENRDTVRRPKYRYQLQDISGVLIARWDNAPHHPGVPTHPFHKHCKDGQIVSSPEMNIRKVLAELDDTLRDVL